MTHSPELVAAIEKVLRKGFKEMGYGDYTETAIAAITAYEEWKREQ